MPELLAMNTLGAPLKAGGPSSKGLTRGKEERGLGSLLTQVRISPSKKSRRQKDLQAVGCVTRANLTKNRTMLLGEVADLESTFDMFDASGAGSERRFEPSSVCLAAMVNEFMEGGGNMKSTYAHLQYGFNHGTSWSTRGDEDTDSTLVRELSETLHHDDIRERALQGEVNEVVVAASDGEGATSQLAYSVMKCLRQAGYNAGICKSRWDHTNDYPGGGYEYIDVDFEGSTTVNRSERIIIDVDFKAQFEIARPTPTYDALVRVLPCIFVGRLSRLLWVVNFMTGAVKSSLKERGMHLPPWRKSEYMRSKWFSTYERTTDSTLLNFIEDTKTSGADCPPWKSAKRIVSQQKSTEVSHVGNMKQPMRADEAEIVDNYKWQPPLLKARRLQGTGNAGLASLFKAASLSAPLNKVGLDQGLRPKHSAVLVAS